MAVVQVVLLYRPKSWSISLKYMEALKRFQKKEVWYMTGTHIQRGGLGEYHYPKHRELYRLCGLKPIYFYIQKQRGTLRHYFETDKAEL